MLTAVRNGARLLPDTIESIRGQTFADWEYIVVDDGSTDETPDVVAAAADNDPRIRLVRRRAAGGPFAAANEGLCHATGRWVVRTDGDDVSLPTRIEHQLRYLRAHPALRACAAYCQTLGPDGPVRGHYNVAPNTSGVLRWYLALRCPLVHSSACVERAALAEIGGYRELPAAQDVRLWSELALRGWLGVVPEVLVHFRQHAGRMSMTRAAEQKALGTQIMAEHVAALTGEPWAPGDVDSLYAVGHAEWHPIDRGLDALRRWDALWQSDARLAAAERAELAALSAFRRRKFLRCNARRQPLHFLAHLRAFVAPRPVRAPAAARAAAGS